MSHRDDWSLSSGLDGAELERQLLASAAADAPPAAASERAFRQLSSDARALAALTALAPVGEARPSPPAAQAAAAATARAPYRAALVGLLLGAAAGAGAVALWLGAAGDRGLLVPPLPPRPALERDVPELSPELAPPPAAKRAEPRRAASERAASERAISERAISERAISDWAASERASRLAREVAALDGARASLAIGASQSTLRQIDRYREEFPDGELAADAEAVAIEALAAEGDHAALAVAVRRFLARYPRDPHAARVRELGFIPSPEPAP